MTRKVESRPPAGASVEAWARLARYRALRAMALENSTDLVLLAHHRRDQAETFLLQALRGGGVAALSAMPQGVRRDGVTWARPWLATPATAIEAYARRHRLRWIDDESNDDPRFDRNRLRRDVWPRLTAAFGEAEASLADAARRAQHASAVVDEIAALDLAAVADDRGLDLAAWRRLSPARQRQALLRWLRAALDASPPASLVERLMSEAETAGDRTWPLAAGELGSYRGRLRVVALAESFEPAPHAIDLSRPGVYQVPSWRGAFVVAAVERGGLATADATTLELRARAPGDRFQAGPRRPPRSLKLQFQAEGVAPAHRNGPIVCRDGVPVFVPGLGLDARALAAPGQAQVSLAWVAR